MHTETSIQIEVLTQNDVDGQPFQWAYRARVGDWTSPPVKWPEWAQAAAERHLAAQG